MVNDGQASVRANASVRATRTETAASVCVTQTEILNSVREARTEAHDQKRQASLLLPPSDQDQISI